MTFDLPAHLHLRRLAVVSLSAHDRLILDPRAARQLPACLCTFNPKPNEGVWELHLPHKQLLCHWMLQDDLLQETSALVQQWQLRCQDLRRKHEAVLTRNIGSEINSEAMAVDRAPIN